jgi:hypothetical protein
LASAKFDWPKVRRINELWLNKQYSYLPEEVGQYLPKKQFPMNNELEYVRGVHQLNLLFLWPILDHTRFGKQTNFIFRTIPALADKPAGQYIDMLKYFVEQGLLQKYAEQLLDRLAQFVDRFKYLIPAFALRFYQKKPRGLKQDKGITTASFEDIKGFYSDTFEVLAEMLPLLVAYNNLRYRGNFQTMRHVRKDVNTLDDLIGKSKGERLQFVDGSETFDRLLSPRLDNKLRNAIAHTSYREDLAHQRITYYPSGVAGKGKAKRIYMIDAVQNCWSIFLCMVDMIELHYQTEKLYYMTVKRNKPIDPRVFRG